jgi:hypothetical protein
MRDHSRQQWRPLLDIAERADPEDGLPLTGGSAAYPDDCFCHERTFATGT